MMEELELNQQTDKCWKIIGVFGYGTCERLDEYSHCKLCPVYSESGRSLFDREAPEDMIKEWTKEISEAKQKEKTNTVSIVIFRIRNEWFALSTLFFKEAVNYRPIHSVPERNNDVFKGIVNINGELLLCLNSANIFGVDTSNEENDDNIKNPTYKRMIVLQENNDRYVLILDEILGVIRLSNDELVKGPSTLVNAPESLSKSIFEYQNKKIGYIDEEKLFASLNRSLNW